MFKKLHIAANFVIILSLLVPGGVLVPLAQASNPGIQTTAGETGIFRTRVIYPNASGRARLDILGVTVLSESQEGALVLAAGDQLETLARLGFRPRAVDDLGALVNANAGMHPWLAEGLARPLDDAAALWKSVAAERFSQSNAPLSAEAQTALAGLHGIVASLSPEQLTAIADSISPDSDGDGLTDTEEAWWCTDPENPNTDGDVNGYTDYEEVTALLDFTLPRSARWGYGPPFGPPNAWPDWNGADGNPDTPACNDGDFDTIPDYAEAYIIGSKVPAESTDGDKFDDGQELFGITYCPGAPTNCGYGSYPAIEYWNFIQAAMPSWVEPPGDNLFVAAFPVPEVSVVPGSWHVERVTTITTQEGEMVQTSNTYQTSAMRGEGSSIADTRTWNNWEEVSEAVETPLDSSPASPRSINSCAGKGFWCYAWGTAKLVGGVAAVPVGAILAAGGTLACPETLGWGCAVAIGGGALATGFGPSIAQSGWDDLFGKDESQNAGGVNVYNHNTNVASADASASVTVENNFDSQGIVNSLDGIQYAINQQGQLLAQGLQDISYQLSRPRLTETHTNGHSWGGAQTTSHEVYEEHTITQGEAFTSGQNWSTAWAVDSSHAADLTWTYRICNTGTEYAREIKNLVFNVYLGDDSEPLVSYPAWQQFSGGAIENFFPGDCAEFTTDPPAALTLDQMRRIDLGERLTVVLEDFSYGADELFYENAVNGGVTVYIEDGVDDGDELVDTYVIPTWGSESIQDVLTRFFPAGVDENGDINSLWTPEFDGINPPTWNEHYLSDIAWWNVYLTQPDAGNTPLREVPAQAGGAILFRFNRDSDRDGYKDSVELRYGTDKDDPVSHPQPEITAGYVKSRDGNVVTVLLKVANSGTFDAYGIDAVMYAPDDTVTIGNNTVGGNGRVRPGNQVAVGSLILAPDLTNWDDSTAKPYAAGSYSGNTDKTFTFSVTAPGVVGQGSTALQWSDSVLSGTLSLGAGYHAPLPVDVADGLQIGFDTGTLMAGDSFTVQALTPRDTFTYTVNSDPYTEPVIVLSYSDPQGSHRFITPVELGSLDEDLTPHGGEMLRGAQLDILTTSAVQAGAPNETRFLINSPHPEPIENAHLYLNFVSDSVLQAELPYTLTLQPGPTVYTVTWSTDIFSDTYDETADNILIVFWTDAQENIIDSAARPFDTFQEDPAAAAGIPAAGQVWDFGSAAQGTLLQRRFYLSSLGFRDLLTYLGTVNGVSVDGPVSAPIAPADLAVYTVTVDTLALPVGPFSATIPIRTSDPAYPQQTIRIQGTVTPASNPQVVVPYLDTDYRYFITTSAPPSGFETVSFDDSTFDLGDASFGTGNCPIETNVKTAWPVNSKLILRKWFNLPPNVSNVTVGIAVDNDVQVFVNGVDVSGGIQQYDGCAANDSFIFSVPDALVHEGNNLLAVLGIDRGGDSYLDAQVTVDGIKQLYSRLTAQTYDNVTFSLQAGQPSDAPGALTFIVDVGADGVVDWSYSGNHTYPTIITSPNLATAFNAYLTGLSGEVDVPIRIIVNPPLSMSLHTLSVTPLNLPDLAPGTIQYPANPTNPTNATNSTNPTSPTGTITEGDTLTLTVSLANGTAQNSGPVTVAFFATLPDFGEWYIGSALVENVPAGGNATAVLSWDTLGFTGEVPVRVVADPYDRLAETDESNNESSTTVTILTRPDLLSGGIALSNPEPMAGESITVTLTVSNGGQTAAGASVLALYDGNPDEGGIPLGTRTLSVDGSTQNTVEFPWLLSQAGLHRLFVQIDRNDAVDESNENNNRAWKDVYVGLASPILLDSGGANDPVYTDTLGYGYVDTGQPDVTVSCGSEPYETLRQDPGGEIAYRFDHLLPGHFYHLDLTLYECDGAGRQEDILVDGNPIAGPEDLSDGRIHHLSLRLDPALYADRSITVGVQAGGIDGAVVSEVNLYDVDYRYADAGSASNDPQYPGTSQRPYGWLDGVPNTAWGILPYQSVRVEQSDDTLRYRFDALDPAKSYQAHFTFWQPSGAGRVQQIQVDGDDTGVSVDTGDYQVHRLSVDIPPAAYADGTVVLSVVRTNASTGAFVNEIALEELTLVPDDVPPVADFSALPTSGNAPLTVQFTDQSSGSILSWAWDFGDGSTSDSPNPVHTYTAAGVYTVALTVSGPGGSNTVTKSDYVAVTGLPPGATVMHIAPPMASASLGMPITVTVEISNVNDLGSFQFSLAYSPTLVTVEDVTLGDFPGSTGRSFTPVGPAVDNVQGLTTFGAFSIGTSPPGASGGGTLAYVKLLPQSGGVAALHLQDTQASDVSGGAISLFTQDGVLNIAACTGDFDGDGDVDILDVQRIAYRWNTHTGDPLYELQYDLDGDGDIDILDVQQVAYRWGTQCVSGGNAPQRSAAPTAGVALAVFPSQQTVSAGQIFTTSVSISDVVDLGAFEFTLGYSPTVVQVLTATLGTFPGSTGRSVVATQPVIDNAAGRIRYGAFSLGDTPPGPDGEGVLAILTLQAVAPGKTPLTLEDATVSDRTGVSQPIGSTQAADVIVNPGWKVYLPLLLR